MAASLGPSGLLSLYKRCEPHSVSGSNPVCPYFVAAQFTEGSQASGHSRDIFVRNRLNDSFRPMLSISTVSKSLLTLSLPCLPCRHSENHQ